MKPISSRYFIDKWIKTCASFLIFIIIACSLENPHTGTVDDTDTGIMAMLYNSDGSPAAGATVEIFEVADTTKIPELRVVSDENGRYSLEELSNGIYNVFAEKGSQVAFQDSVMVLEDTVIIEQDTLETPMSLTAIIGLQPNHDPRTVSVQVLGTDIYANVDADGFFILNRMAQGDFTLKLSSSLDGYTTTYKSITVTRETPDTLTDTLWLIYTGIPVVIELRGSYDPITGIARLNWQPVKYRDFLEYLVYRDFSDSLKWTEEPLYATSDSFIIDTIFTAVPNAHQFSLLDTSTINFKYRVAIRSNSNEIGKTYKQVPIDAKSPSMQLKLLSPIEGHVIRDTNVAFIIWKSIEAAKEYAIHISSTQEYTDTVDFSKTTDTILTSSVLDSGDYFCRIKAKNENEEWSGWLREFTFSVAGPEKPALVFPKDTVIGSSDLQKINFLWKNVPFGSSYDIQISRQSSFNQIENESTCSDTQISFELPTGNYYWRCRSKNSSNTAGEWSGTANFSLGIFTKVIGGKSNEQAVGAIQTDDGGFIILGSTSSYGSGGQDIMLVKLASNGNVEWEKYFGGSKDENPGSIIQTSDKSLFIVGSSESFSNDGKAGVLIIKSDQNGDTIWSKTYRFNEYDFAQSIAETNDGGFIIGGSSRITRSGNTSGPEALVVRINSAGDSIWSRIYGAEQKKGGYASFVMPQEDGGYIVAGASGSLTNGDALMGNSIYLMGIDELGDSVWLKSCQTQLCNLYTYRRIRTGGFILSGQSLHGESTIHKYNDDFIEEWVQVFYATYVNGYNNVIECENGYAIVGTKNNNISLIKTNSDGSQQWVKEYGGTKFEEGHGIITTNDGGFLIVGSETDPVSYDLNLFIVKTDKNGETINK